MLFKAANANLIKHLCSNLYPGAVIRLQYADDTILFSAKNIDYATNFKWVITFFEQVSHMRINYSKSELIPLCLVEEEILVFTEILGCAIGKFPTKYLGTPLHYDKLRKEDI
jgi:hypothetical protein